MCLPTHDSTNSAGFKSIYGERCTVSKHRYELITYLLDMQINIQWGAKVQDHCFLFLIQMFHIIN